MHTGPQNQGDDQLRKKVEARVYVLSDAFVSLLSPSIWSYEEFERSHLRKWIHPTNSTSEYMDVDRTRQATTSDPSTASGF